MTKRSKLKVEDRSASLGAALTRPILTGLPPNLEEHLTDEILGGVPHEAQNKPEDTHVVPCVQNLHGLGIAGGNRLASRSISVMTSSLHRFASFRETCVAFRQHLLEK
jgi:hypothetical protein